MLRLVAAVALPPAAPFLALFLLWTRRSFGWWDTLAGLGVAFALTYGFMLAAVLPVHMVRARSGADGLGGFLAACLCATAGVVAALTFAELLVNVVLDEFVRPGRSPVGDSAWETGPSLLFGLWLPTLVVEGVLVGVMGTAFWFLMPRPPGRRRQSERVPAGGGPRAGARDGAHG